MKKIIGVLAVVIAGLVVLANCSGGAPLREIAEARTVPSSPNGPVVVFLPGTLASVLVDTRTGEKVWGRSDALSVDPRDTDSLRQLSLPLDAVPSDVSAAPDTIRAADVLRRANESIVGIPISLAIYEDMLEAMAATGLRETAPLAIPANGPSLTVFPYDWRRSIVDAARELGDTLESRGEGARKVQLVGHSMGGVVALWYLMHGTAPLDSAGAPPPITWAGAKHVERAILVGAPLRGSAIAVRNTVNGNKIAGPLIPVYPPTMLASHPSSFELMPRGDVLAGTDAPLMDAATWQRFKWGMADPNERPNIEILGRGAADALALASARQAALIARGRTFHRASDRPVQPPEGLTLTVIAGTGSETAVEIDVSPDGNKISLGRTATGDGTVLESSAIAGFEDAATHPRKASYLYEVEHTRMLSDPPVFEKVLDIIFEK